MSEEINKIFVFFFLLFTSDFCISVGPLAVIKNPPELEVIERELKDVKSGGMHLPSNCIARHKVAIIIPFRDRMRHLETLLFNLHPILLRQQIDYEIFVIEQEGNLHLSRFID